MIMLLMHNNFGKLNMIQPKMSNTNEDKNRK